MTDILDGLRPVPHLGEALSLVAALVWATAVVMFRVVGRDVHALAMNFFKNWLAVGLLALTMAVFGQPLLPPLPAGHTGLFILSGILGIAVSDTLFLTALQKLGAELTAIVDCAYSPFVIGLSFLFLGERMNGLQAAGVALIVAAMVLIAQKKADVQIARRDLLLGIGLGVLSMFFTAASIVMIKPLLGRTPLLWANLARIAGGAVSISLVLALHPRRAAILRPLRSMPTLRILAPASFLGTYLSNLFWIAGFRYTQASIAAALNQLNTVFIFLLAAWFLKEKVTPLKLAAVALAFAGAMLVSFPS